MSTLFSTPAERHVFAIGFFETLCPWKARYNNADSCPDCLKDEYHYYLVGRVAGFIALLIVIGIFITLLKEVLT